MCRQLLLEAGALLSRRVVLALVVAFIAVDAVGLCSTYGWITWA